MDSRLRGNDECEVWNVDSDKRRMLEDMSTVGF